MILGSEGQTGRELSRLIKNPIRVSHSNSSGHLSMEFTDTGNLSKLIIEHSPNVIVNTVALTNVDECETNKEYAYRVNAAAVREIAKASSYTKSKLIHISTDYVFDGMDGNYSEDAIPNPINYYGLSKLLGDCYAESSYNTIILRTSGVYGFSKNYPRFVYDTLTSGSSVKAIAGFYSPIHAYNLARAIKELINIDYSGVINIAGERVSRYNFAKRISEHFHIDGNIEETETLHKLNARRPFDSSLNIDKAKSILNFDFHSIESNLKEFERTLKEK